MNMSRQRVPLKIGGLPQEFRLEALGIGGAALPRAMAWRCVALRRFCPSPR